MEKKINIFFPILIGVYIIGSILVATVIGMFEIKMPMWLSCVVSQAMLLLPAIFYAIINKINIVKFIPYKKIRFKEAILSILIGYLLIPLVMFINVFSTLFSSNYMNDTIGEISNYPFVMQILLLAIMPPMVEEFIFRGLFYNSYRYKGIVGAAIFSAIAFGVTHMNINQFCYATILGIILCFLIEATGSIWSSILAHFAINTYSVSVLKLTTLVSPETTEEIKNSQQAQMQMGEIASTLLILGVIACMTCYIAYRIIKKMAIRNGNSEFIKDQIANKFKFRDSEKYVTLPYTLTVVFAFIYMISVEVLGMLL